jgi:hypothetical protein
MLYQTSTSPAVCSETRRRELIRQRNVSSSGTGRNRVCVVALSLPETRFRTLSSPSQLTNPSNPKEREFTNIPLKLILPSLLSFSGIRSHLICTSCTCAKFRLSGGGSGGGVARGVRKFKFDTKRRSKRIENLEFGSKVIDCNKSVCTMWCSG